MKIQSRLIGNVSKSAHPYGCRQSIIEQIEYVKKNDNYEGPKKVLILGASSSYGLASRISLAFGAHADTIGVSFEKGIESEAKLATAGWWNNIFFKEEAEKEGLIAKNFIGDAFSDEMRKQVIEYIKEEFGGKIDLLIYSLASGRRTEPSTGITYSSVLKPIGHSVSGFNINLEKEELFIQDADPATEEEIHATIKVMGGEDWELWIKALLEENVLADGFKTTLFSYIGPEVTRPFYRTGTLGMAKKHTEETSEKLNELLKEKVNGESIICVSKAIITKASVVIPVLPIYTAALYKIMLEKDIHEDAIMHKHRFFRDMLYGNNRELDEQGRLRPDYWEMRDDVQAEVKEIMNKITPENFKDLIDLELCKKEFLKLNGFEYTTINYDEDIDIEFLKKLEP
jgi:enoyl-[acyl-carrier protein] reductase/trans-2-enoyl-CoA reductase (NAD+)